MKTTAKAFRGKDGTLIRVLLAEAQFDPELALALRERWTMPKHRMAVDYFREGVRLGVLRPDIDPDAMIDLLYAPFPLMSSSIRTAMDQLISVAPSPTPAPTATGRRYLWRSPVSPAVIAARTRMHSNPSRKTSTAMSKTAEPPVCLRRERIWITKRDDAFPRQYGDNHDGHDN
jgi:hypothetical protein